MVQRAGIRPSGHGGIDQGGTGSSRRVGPVWPALLGAMALLVAASAQARPPKDLGTLPGGYTSTARSVNAKGLIAGLASDPVSFNSVQVLWRQGAIEPWAACCGAGTGIPNALNRKGEAAGYANEGYEYGHWYWSATGLPVRLPGLPVDGIDRGAAYDINDRGTIVGYSVDNALRRHAVVWQRTRFAADLSSEVGGTHSVARGINNLGDIVGDVDGQVFLRTAGGIQWLGTGTAEGVNDAGLVIGYAPGFIPVLWRDGVREYLPALYGGGIAYGHDVTGLNNLGDIVGYTTQEGSLDNTAVLWRNGKAIDLGRYPGGTKSMAYDVNDKGQIVGEGNLEPGGPMHALRWTVKTGTAGTVVQVERAD